MQIHRFVRRRCVLVWLVGLVLIPGRFTARAGVSLSCREGSPRVEFALSRLASTVSKRGQFWSRMPLDQAASARVNLIIGAGEARQHGWPDALAQDPGPEGFRFVWSRDKKRLCIASPDESGAMYGLLELAEALRNGERLEAVSARVVRARFPFRTIKFNLPWMSYRKGRALQIHQETCRDLAFWESFLNMMAENRFNTLTLWNLHPFTFLIRPKNFPEACSFDKAELAQWQHFWRELFRMARDRGIDTYLVNWNIFVSPALARARGVAEYSIDWKFFGEGDASKLVERYTRECVTQVINEYPDLTGLGITLGEGMGGMTPAERRDWLERTFIAGMRAADRPARFIHRAPLSAGKGSGGSTSTTTEQLTRAALETMALPEPIWVEFKYNWSHGHSSPRLHIVHGGKLTDTYWNPMPENYRVVWTIRNEDFFVLRWGEPDFIRAFIRNNGQEHVGGCLVGSECYIPAYDYMTQEGPHKSWKHAFERQWLFYKLWGRLLYDPQTPDTIFERELEHRFGEGIGKDLLRAWKLASRSQLRFATFYRGTWDATLYSEGFTGWRDGNAAAFIDVDSLIRRDTLDPRYLSIREFVAHGLQTPADRVSPLHLADDLERDCGHALSLAESVAAKIPDSPGLHCELADIEAWSHHGLYFAEKLRGGVALAAFRLTGEAPRQNEAIQSLERAARQWERLTGAVTRYNRAEIPYLFDESFSWRKHLPAVRADIETARKAIPDR